MHVRRECRKEGEEVGTQKWDKVYLTLKLFKTPEKLFSPHTCIAFEEGKVLPMLIRKKSFKANVLLDLCRVFWAKINGCEVL